MYRNNSLFLGLCSLVGLIVAANSFFVDAAITVRNFGWAFDQFKASDVDRQIYQLATPLMIKLETLIESQGFWLVFLPIIFFWWWNARNRGF